MKKKIHKGTALDLIQTAYMESHIPLIYCYMVLDTAIDVNRLKQAVSRTVEVIPQILRGYNETRNAWIPTKYVSNSIVKIVSDNNCDEDLIWDLHTVYSVEPISYTNMGTIDEKIFFQEITIKECYLCGTYRQAPSFQVSISTYKNGCTLAVNMCGTEKQRIIGMKILNKMKSALIFEL